MTDARKECSRYFLKNSKSCLPSKNTCGSNRDDEIFNIISFAVLNTCIEHIHLIGEAEILEEVCHNSVSKCSQSILTGLSVLYRFFGFNHVHRYNDIKHNIHGLNQWINLSLPSFALKDCDVKYIIRTREMSSNLERVRYLSYKITIHRQNNTILGL